MLKTKMDIITVKKWITNFVCVFVCVCCVTTTLLTASDCHIDKTNSKLLICSDISKLNSISSETANKIESFRLTNCLSHSLPKNFLNLLSKVTQVEVECQIETQGTNDTSGSFVIEKNAFSDATNLTTINMKGNDIASIPTSEFCSLDKLQWLFLENNRIQDGDMLGLSYSCQEPCGQRLEYFYLGNNRLEMIKNSSFLCQLRNLIRLDLGNNLIKTIEMNAFANTTSLKYLHLSNNSLSELDENTFQHMQSLQELHLSGNKLKVVTHLFKKLRNLKKLSLEYNLIEQFTSDTFEGLVNLVNLHLAHNLISSIPNYLFRSLEALSFLFLNNNRLSRLEANAFNGLTELSYLNLDDNLISHISETTFEQVPYLTWLYVRNNRLTHIPSSFPLTILVELYFTNNSIESLTQATFDNMTQLEILHLQENNIEHLEDFTFQNLTSLKQFNLANNQITTIGNETFEGLGNLETLRLDCNFLNVTNNIYTDPYILHKAHVFNSLSKLINLNLSHNLIEEYRYRWWPETLQNLNLSHNLIKELYTDGFALPTIKNIDLRHNQLKHIQTRQLPRTAERIFLSYNHLTDIDKDAFVANPVLRLVLLDNNRLRTLDVSPPDFERDIGIVKLHLYNNPWSCDCHLKWLKDVLNGDEKSYFIEDAQQLKCERKYSRNRDIVIPVLEANSREDFMCTFNKNDSNFCIQWVNMNNEVCGQECPDQCTCYRGANWETINVDCTGKNLTHIPRNLHPVTMSLFLDKNNIKHIRKDDFPPMIFIYQIQLNDNGLESIEDGSFEHIDTLDYLFLQSNLLRNLAPDLFVNLSQLITLDLSHNQLSNLSDQLFSPLHSLETLYLNDNKLFYFPVWTLQKLHSLSSIGLYNNPWSCDCDYAASYIEWMRNYARKLINSDQIYCLSESGRNISYIAFNDSLCFNSTITNVVLNQRQVAALVSSLVFFVVVTLLSLLVFIYRHEMQVLIYSRYGVRLFHNVEDDDREKMYDAFVSYSSLDEEFVVRHVIPGLENIENPYKLCLHHRDFPIGSFINESIFDAIDKSRRTILILSRNFVRSEWCRFEFRTAHSQMLQDRRNRVIVIVLGEIPNELDSAMKLYMRTNTYLCWNDNLFWQKLYFALPEKTYELNEEDVL